MQLAKHDIPLGAGCKGNRTPKKKVSWSKQVLTDDNRIPLQLETATEIYGNTQTITNSNKSSQLPATETQYNIHVGHPPSSTTSSIPIPQPWYVPNLLSPSDLCHVDLLPVHSQDTTTYIRPPPPPELYQTESTPTGTALPPVPTYLTEKIESGAFIKMGGLIPICLGLDDTAQSKLRRSVTNINEWL